MSEKADRARAIAETRSEATIFFRKKLLRPFEEGRIGVDGKLLLTARAGSDGASAREPSGERIGIL